VEVKRMRKKLIALREAKGFTQKKALAQRDVALALGISRSHYTKIEAGIRNPNLALARRIAEYFGVSVEDLFFAPEGGDESRESAKE
jgi:transcriptional regulator with XRE-family HTH domain